MSLPIKIPTKKLASGFEMPVYGLGTWKMGGVKQASNDTDNQDTTGIRSAIEKGITHIDTAEMYGNGHAEELIGNVINEFDRSKLFLTSKASFDFSYDGILRAAECSLRRLQTDYLDLYLIHFMKPEYPLDESMKAMSRLIDEGIIKHIGLSDFSWQAFSKAQSYANHKLVCNQVHYSMKVREVERKGVLSYAQKNDIFLTAWRPLHYGELATNPPEILNKMMLKYNKTAAQIALNWLISQDKVITLAKTSTPEHIDDNLGAFGFMMDDSDIEQIRVDYPDQLAESDSVRLNLESFA